MVVSDECCVPVPYYDDGRTTLYNGDCLEVLAALDERFDLVFTSPPYNLGVNPGRQFGHWKDGANRGGAGAWKKADSGKVIDYDSHHDDMPYLDYVEWQKAVIEACWTHLTDTGAIFYNHKPRVQRDGLLIPFPMVDDYPVRQVVIWDRGSGFNFTKTAYTPQHEWIIVVAPEAFRLVKKGAAGDVWRVTPDVGNPHPAPFPVSLPAKAIETTGAGSLIDPFCGSGSALVAAQQAGIRAVGIDVSERYCEMAAKRLTQTALFGEAI